jgi:hypothetical protein
MHHQPTWLLLALLLPLLLPLLPAPPPAPPACPSRPAPQNKQALRAVAAHKPGPKTLQPDGQPDHSGVRGMTLENEGRTLYTGEEGAGSGWM